MTISTAEDKRPQPDPAEDNAFFPSPYSLSQFTSPKSDLSGADYPSPYTGARKVLLIGADERYLLTDNGTMFSTGNHPVETLLPMYHIDKAGFAFDVATLSGNPVKFEWWAMPREDAEITGLFDRYRTAFKQPRTLADIIAEGLDAADYAAVFIPGGHGALMGLPDSEDVKAVLEWAAARERFVITLCHGPAALLATGSDNPYRGYAICAFPDALDATTPDIGYMPGHLTWKFGEKLKAQGFQILNDGISGASTATAPCSPATARWQATHWAASLRIPCWRISSADSPPPEGVRGSPLVDDRRSGNAVDRPVPGICHATQHNHLIGCAVVPAPHPLFWPFRAGSCRSTCP